MVDWDGLYARRAGGVTASDIRELLKLLERPEIISFAGGIPDPALFPRQHLADAFARILGDPARAAAALQYSASEGYRPLREWVAAYMGGLGVSCTPDHILVTNGAQQALDFLGKLFVAPGDAVLVARPTYLGALQAMNAYEAAYAPLPLPGDNDDRTPASGRPALGYVMPEFQNPTGLSLDLAARRHLLEVAVARGLPLVEDAAYEALRYEGAALPSLLALDAESNGGIDQCRVLYCGTFSKTVVPGLRVGWIVAPQAVIRRLVLIKQASDLHSATLNQMVMHEVAVALLPASLSPLREVYRRRRDAMLDALAAHMPPGVHWTKPAGGMFVWLTLPPHTDAGALLPRAIAEASVAFVPGRAFHPNGGGANTLRLNFTFADEGRIAEGVARLGGVLRCQPAMAD